MPLWLQDTVECSLVTAPSAELNQGGYSNPRLQLFTRSIYSNRQEPIRMGEDDRKERQTHSW